VRPSPVRKGTPTPADWSALGNRLPGRLVRPGDARYPVALRLFDPRFDAVHPAGIAYCTDAKDIAACLAFARETGVEFAVRAGGHSYAGYSTSTGLILDVTGLGTITPAAGSGGTAMVGAGARLVDVYARLAAAGVSIPAGSCPTVGVAGLTLGGGVGVVGRRYGLTCDRLIAADVVLASGETVRVDENHDSDLFWALRGGGAGNFGVVTSFTFATHATRPLTLFTYRWSWDHAAAVLDGWQRWAPFAPDELWSNCLLSSYPPAGTSGSPRAAVNGVYVGDPAALRGPLADLVAGVSAAPTGTFVGMRDYASAMLIEAGCGGMSTAACHLPSQNPAGTLSRAAQLSASDYLTTTLPAAGINALLGGIERRQRTTGLAAGAANIDAYGGAINRVPPADTAFVHRSTRACIQYTAEFSVTDPAGTQTANAAWVTSARAAMHPYVSGQAYQNYIDPALTDWKRAYYGTNYARLVRVKSTYDPNALFRYPLAIPTH
jgi:FAD/FMN-containing dehydrogenase